MKKCPFCQEEVQDLAIKCKHCGEFIEDVEVLPAVLPQHDSSAEKYVWFSDPWLLIVASVFAVPMIFLCMWIDTVPAWKMLLALLGLYAVLAVLKWMIMIFLGIFGSSLRFNSSGKK